METMRPSIPSSSLLLALLLSLPPPCPAQLGFEDLASGTGDGRTPVALPPGAAGAAGTGTGTGDGRGGFPLHAGAHPVSPHWDGVVADLAEADRQLVSAMDLYAEIYRAAEYQSDSGRNKLGFSDLARYNRAVRLADDLSAAILAANGKLQAAHRTLATMEARDEPAWALEARLESVRLATLHDQLHGWAGARSMFYNGPHWRDSQSRPLLTSRWEARPVGLPTSSGVRRGTHLSVSVAEPLSDRYLAGLDAALADAAEARQILERERIKPANPDEERRSLTGWILYRYTTTSIFDTLVKPTSVRFALAMLRAKANLNAAILATESPSGGRFSDRSHTALRMAMMKYVPLVWWGDYRHLQVVSSWGLRQRELWIFDGGGFRDQHRVRTGGIESRHFDDVVRFLESQGSRSTLGGTD